MKSIRLKLGKQDARLFAEILSQLIQLVPDRANYEDQGGDWYYTVDRCMLGIVALIWQKYYTKLLSCDASITINLPEPHALAYLICASEVKKWQSKDHELLVLQTTSLINQST